MRVLKLAVLISGGGTTLKNLLDRQAAGQLDLEIPLVISSNSRAGGLEIASNAQLPSMIIRRRDYDNSELHSEAIFGALRAVQPDYVLMGGFLSHVLIPEDFENRVINTHPSLIPAFCGKGFYGHHVHRAVLDYGAKISGCTIHFVDNEYDHGPIITQRAVTVRDDDTPDTLQQRVFAEECEAIPHVLKWLATDAIKIDGRLVRTDDA